MLYNKKQAWEAVMSWIVFSQDWQASPMAQKMKNLFAVQEKQEMQVRSLGWEDPLEGEMATHSSILPGISPWTEGPWPATAHAFTKSQTWLSMHTYAQVQTGMYWDQCF